jgi:hypothetical protein
VPEQGGKAQAELGARHARSKMSSWGFSHYIGATLQIGGSEGSLNGNHVAVGRGCDAAVSGIIKVTFGGPVR